jgi:hypothetical protein
VRGQRRVAKQAASGAAVVGAAGALCWLYLRQARTIWVTSDGASNALQAWDMLHGNLLLRGWWLSDVTFYTTELPEYMLVETARGLSASVVWTGAAITYTLLVVGTALLAAGRPAGQPGSTRLARGLLAAGIVLAPSSVLGTPMLLSSPNHTGTSVPLLAALLLIDRAAVARTARRWWLAPVVTGLLLAWVQVADQVALFAGAIPVAVVCGARWARGRERADLALAVAAVASVPAALGALRVTRALGGFYVSPVTAGTGLLAPLSQLPYHARMLGESALVIFGANYFDQPSATLRAIAWAHVAGLALVLAGLLAAARRLLAGRLDRVSQVLLAAIVVLVVAGLLGTHLSDILAAHEVAVVAPFGAVLAGRMVGGALATPRLAPLLGVGLVASLGFLCYDGSLASYGAGSQPVADWLVRHHMGNGVAGYWQADVTTLVSGGRVTVAPVSLTSGAIYQWEAEAAWYARSAHYAISPPDPTRATSPALARALFGPPARVYHVDGWVIQVWHRDVLATVRGATVRLLGQQGRG